MQILKNRQNEIENKLDSFQSSATISLNYMQQSLQTFKDQIESNRDEDDHAPK